MIAAVVKPILGILDRYPSQGRLQGGGQRLAGAGSGRAQVDFELAEGQFN